MNWFIEWLLVHFFQDRLGIPRWWLIRTSLCLGIMFATLNDVVRQQITWYGVVFIFFGLYVWISNSALFREAQSKADRTMLIVPTPVLVRWVWIIFTHSTFILWLWAKTRQPPPPHVFEIIMEAANVFGMSLLSTHTYPMTGPLFTERVKGLFKAKKKLVGATNET